jgi:hypothetical protein
MDNAKRAHDIDDLRILIVSTPKTGNTWVKHLLATIYDLPIVPIGMAFDADEIAGLGPRWITHQHYAARPEVIDCAQRNNIVMVTTIRHPCDALLSMFHFVRNFSDRLVFADVDPAPQMARDGDTMGEHTAAYVKNGFSTSLDISLSWIRSGRSHVVRYEDLQADPVAALQGLTADICPVPSDQIQRAIELCDIDRMRNLPGQDPRFFRKGAVGGWRAEIPQKITDIFRQTEPYPSQFAALGYSLYQDLPIALSPRRLAALDQVRATAEVNPHLPIAWPTWPKGVWPKVEALAQKVVRGLLRWYINPIVEQQNRYNQAVAEALEEMWQEIVEPQGAVVPGQQEVRSENE